MSYKYKYKSYNLPIELSVHTHQEIWFIVYTLHEDLRIANSFICIWTVNYKDNINEPV